MNHKNYISHLKALLVKEGLSQQQLAKRLDVTFAALNRWLNGRATPHPAKIQSIERLYRESIGYPAIAAGALRELEREADSLRIKGLWAKIARNTALQKELLLDHTYNSTTIEGATFTRNQTKVVLFEHTTFPAKSMSEHLDVTNHAAILKDILRKRVKGPIHEFFVQYLHLRLMQGIRDDAGIYSTHERRILGSPIALTHPKDIPEEMGNLMKSWKRSRSVRKVSGIADFHAQFELIHPFGDGNGRIGRLLMVMQCLEVDLPPVVIENSRKAEYYDVLEYAQRKSAGPFIAFLVDEMKRTHREVRGYLR